MYPVDPRELGEQVADALRELLRERLSCRPGGHLVEAELGEIELSLRVGLGRPLGARSLFVEGLIASIDAAIDDAVGRVAAFRPGHAYCHRCQQVACAHSRPPSCRHVFAGYAPTGQPRWEDFAQLCLDRKHPRVDELYRNRPAILTVVQGGPALHGAMVAAFQDPAYGLLGQVAAGFFPVRGRAEEGRSVVALTVQVAASGSPRGRVRLGLNLLGRTPSGEDLDRLWDRHDELPWRRAVRWAQAALETLPIGRAARERPEIGPRAERILEGLARRLERGHRARERRTRHAEQRHLTGERPTGKALDDARAAQGDALYVDERSGTLIVLGDRGRTHFFTPEGRLVSSVRYSRETIERRLKTALWSRASRSVGERFLARLSGEGGSES